MKTGKYSKTIILLLFFWLSSASAFEPEAVGANPDLVALNAGWVPPTIYDVTDGVYVAVGYGRANPVLIEGTDGLIVVDPGESTKSAEMVKAAYNDHLDDIFSRKSVKAIIYTHYHDCHMEGTSVFAGNDSPEIIAHETFEEALFSPTALYSQIGPIKVYRAVKYAGIAWQNDPGYFVNGGIFPFSIPGPSGYLPPTLTVGDELETNIAGVNLTLVHAPGETTDIIYVWMPDDKVLIQIGNFYKSFPAINTLRGASHRDPLNYIASIDDMRKLNAEYLVLIHSGGGPIVGADNISLTLTNARDALQYVHDQTVRYMNQGLTPGEIIEVIELPPHLANDPNLKEYFGEVDRDVFQIFQQYMGWFTGKSRDIFPTTPTEEAEKMAYLAGGTEELGVKAKAALDEGDMKWALIFSDYVLVLDPENAEAREVKNTALISLAEESSNAQVRNYLLSEYLEETGQINTTRVLDYGFSLMDENIAFYMPMKAIFRIMAVSLNSSKALDEEYLVGLELSDDPVSGDYAIYVRRGIVEVQQETAEDPKFAVVTDSLTWKNLVLGKLDPYEAVSSGEVEISGDDPEEFFGFMGLFK
ncbi:MAG TPA: alkyl sulfatase dimerization domain-containing protein [Methanothrix sp.]|mgnify:CR=1 FL=1|nr:alkyl sulfatase dimerization domain-containing protein [Methanothrix sp.]HPR66030.1 alkyl sulfatase dimerization domain-containing protein [Methanothrix sp.]